jgi:hypothetical protein
MTDVELHILIICVIGAVIAVNSVLVTITVFYAKKTYKYIKNISDTVRRIRNITITTLEQNYERAESESSATS